MQIHQLRILRIVEAQLIAGLSVRKTPGQQAGTGRVLRQRPRRRIVRIVDHARHKGPIRISPDKTDHHFLPDARQEQRAVAVAGPRLCHLHPARRGFIRGTLPMKPDLAPPVLVRPNLCTCLARDHTRKRAAHAGPREKRQGAITGGSGHRGNIRQETPGFGSAVTGERCRKTDFRSHPPGIHLPVGVPLHCKGASCGQPRTGRAPAQLEPSRLARVQADSREPFAGLLIDMPGQRIAEAREPFSRGRGKAGFRGQRVIVIHGARSRSNLP